MKINPKNLTPKILLLGAIVVAGIIIAGNNLVNKQQNDLDNDNTTINGGGKKNAESNAPVRGDNTKPKSPFNTIAGSNNIPSLSECEDAECFDKYFKKCEHATFHTGNSKQTMSYEIIKKVENGCVVNFKYTAFPKEEWVNKVMTCTVDNTNGYRRAAEDVFLNITIDKVKCEGPLYDILSKLES